MDEEAFDDLCDDGSDPGYGFGSYEDTSHDCHILSGWMAGATSCPLWTELVGMCQTNEERSFLLEYHRFVKDRQFPALIPQVRIGIAERRRPDFVAFVPTTYWKYQKFAIELDAKHPTTAVQKESDKARNKELMEAGYEVLSLKANPGFRDVQRLVEKFEQYITWAERAFDNLALELESEAIEEKSIAPF